MKKSISILKCLIFISLFYSSFALSQQVQSQKKETLSKCSYCKQLYKFYDNITTQLKHKTDTNIIKKELNKFQTNYNSIKSQFIEDDQMKIEKGFNLSFKFIAKLPQFEADLNQSEPTDRANFMHMQMWIELEKGYCKELIGSNCDKK